MLQQRKKDYFQRIIEEFFAKLFKLVDNKHESDETKKKLLDECYLFFSNNFDIHDTDTATDICKKIDDYQLTEQYAKIILMEEQLINENNKEKLQTALNIVELIDKEDTTFSWDRITLREDILKHIEENN